MFLLKSIPFKFSVQRFNRLVPFNPDPAVMDKYLVATYHAPLVFHGS